MPWLKWSAKEESRDWKMAQMSVVILPNDHGRLANFDLEQRTTKFLMISAMPDRDFYYEAQLQGGSPMPKPYSNGT